MKQVFVWIMFITILALVWVFDEPFAIIWPLLGFLIGWVVGERSRNRKKFKEDLAKAQKERLSK